MKDVKRRLATTAAAFSALAAITATTVLTTASGAIARPADGPYEIKAGTADNGTVEVTGISTAPGQPVFWIGTRSPRGHGEGVCEKVTWDIDLSLGASADGRRVGKVNSGLYDGCWILSPLDDDPTIKHVGSWSINLVGRPGTITRVLIDQVDLLVKSSEPTAPCQFHLKGAVAATFDSQTQRLRLLAKPPKGRQLHVEGVKGAACADNPIALTNGGGAWLRGPMKLSNPVGPISIS